MKIRAFDGFTDYSCDGGFVVDEVVKRRCLAVLRNPSNARAITALLNAVDRGANVNTPGDWGRTPLHFAVWDGGANAVKIVEMLVQAGADVNARDDRLQENALGFALREFKDELEPAIRLLRERGSHEPLQ